MNARTKSISVNIFFPLEFAVKVLIVRPGIMIGFSDPTETALVNAVKTVVWRWY